jgi:hypothetical protein
MLNKSQYILLASVMSTEVRLSAAESLAGEGAVMIVQASLYYVPGRE